jgi:hypothetical protein
VERTRASSRGGSGRGPCANDAHRQTHQCRVSHRSFDPAGQHHDAGARFGRDATCAARASNRCQRLIVHPDDGPGAGSGEEATEAQAHASAGGAGADRAGRAAAARRLKRLMLSKAVADR